MRFIKDTILGIIYLTIGIILFILAGFLLCAYFKYIMSPAVDYIVELNQGYDFTDPLQALRAAFSLVIGLLICSPAIAVFSCLDYNPIATFSVNKR